ncbi:MAG TPA: glutamate--tRNA ligase [Thermomicrobiales bacterium]
MAENPPTTPMRVRFAPSPTGYLHVGGARSALFNWMAARQSGGTFILRIEDTDQRRLNEDSLDAITDGLRWLGLQWDEGPEVGGPYAPYIQSERLPDYQQWARWLLENGHAYEDFDPPSPPGKNATPDTTHTFRKYRDWTPAQRDEARATSETPPAIRFKTPLDGETVAYDVVRGEMRWQNRDIPADPVLLKRDGYPTYHLAVVVDDHAMAITHIMRAVEWIPNLPIHALLYDAFGWERPSWCHLPLVTRTDGKKFSKRHGDSALHEYREQGFLPEALVNFCALLGWSFGDDIELFSKEEAAARFRIEEIRPAPSAWDKDKLLWMNGQWINHRLTLDDFVDRALPFLHDADLAHDAPRDYVSQALALEKERVKTLAEVPEATRFFFKEPAADAEMAALLKQQGGDRAQDVLEAVLTVLADADWRSRDALFAAMDSVKESVGVNRSRLFGAVRVATTGRKAAPDQADLMLVLGPGRVDQRLRAAIEALKAVEEA